MSGALRPRFASLGDEGSAVQLQGPSQQQMLFTEQGGEAGRCFCFSELGFQEGANLSLQTYYSSQRGWTCGEEESP